MPIDDAGQVGADSRESLEAAGLCVDDDNRLIVNRHDRTAVQWEITDRTHQRPPPFAAAGPCRRPQVTDDGYHYPAQCTYYRKAQQPADEAPPAYFGLINVCLHFNLFVHNAISPFS